MDQSDQRYSKIDIWEGRAPARQWSCGSITLPLLAFLAGVLLDYTRLGVHYFSYCRGSAMKGQGNVGKRDSILYETFTLAVSVLSLLQVAGIILLPRTNAARLIMENTDSVFCLYFFGDFLYRLVATEQRIHYLFTWGILDLLSSIPLAVEFRFVRLARAVRFLRLIRTLKSSSQFVQVFVKRKAEAALYGMALLMLVLIAVGSIAVLEFESASPDANIVMPGDALWWTIVTMSTVGYGDFWPVTTGGRLVAVVLIVYGISLFGTFTAYLATRLAPTNVQRETESERENET